MSHKIKAKNRYMLQLSKILFFIIGPGTCYVLSFTSQWQTLAGSCPLPAAVGDADSGKSTACKVAIACTGGWKHNFFASVSEKV